MSIIDITGTPFPSLKGRVALLTGASSGIGLATATLLDSLSCSVLIADLSPPPSSASPTLRFVKTDVTSYASLLAAFDHCAATLSSYPDIVFANAGIGERENYFVDVNDENVRTEPKHEVLKVDIEAVANTVRIGWWGMKKLAGPKSIVMTASFAGYQGQPGLGMYNAAKHAVVGLLRALRYDAPKDRIAISLVAPAITVTPIISDSASFADVAKGLARAGVPLNTPERIAEAVVWLIVQGAAANGAGLLVQGGQCVDLEKSIAKTRGSWMGEQMARLYKGGKGVNVFENMKTPKVGAKL